LEGSIEVTGIDRDGTQPEFLSAGLRRFHRLPTAGKNARNHLPMIKDLQDIKARLGLGLAQLPYLPRTLALVWTASRGLTAARLVLLVVQGLLPVATVHLIRQLVNDLVATMRVGRAWQDLRPALFVVALLAGIMLLTELLQNLSKWVCAAQSELVKDHITGLIHRKSASMDLAFYETPEFYDHLHRARADAAHRPVTLLENLGGLFQHGVTLAGMAAILIPYGAWLPAALLASTLPALGAVLRSTAAHQLWYRGATAAERRTWYYDWMLTTGETAAELRLFGTGRHFQSSYQLLRRRLRGELLDLKRTQILYEFGAGAIALAITGCVMIWMVWRALQGLATLGDLALFYQAFNQGHILLRSLLQNTGQIYANILFLGDLYEFLALQPALVDPPFPLPVPSGLKDGIRFDHVTFHYPGSEKAALQDFSLVIPGGQFAAIVGANGAGKSTLIKLLCRLYDPDQGCLELDSTDIRKFNIGDLRGRMSVLFQVPVHYNATVRENIILGDLKALPREGEIEAAAQASGAAELISRLPKGYENMLGRWFEGGAELSVGEWQKIALARAFLRRAPILLLDEPTSAMDPWAEADWLQRFRCSTRGQTSILITHRMTTAMYADIIHVMEDGRIVESGTHSQLLAQGDRYALSWAKQMESCV
jgi:ATP-binding cassette subfamily B protein